MTNMTTKCVIGIVLLAAAAWAADAVPPLDVRSGMWEGTMTIQTSGTPTIPPELLAKMTPEQKAALEAHIKSRESGGSKTSVTKHCYTKEDLKKGLNFGDEKGSCQHTVVNGSSSKQEMRIECANAGIKSHGTIHIEAVDPEHVKISSQISMGDGSRTMNVNATGTGRWVSDTCTSDAKK
jgi:hypothetical protein